MELTLILNSGYTSSRIFYSHHRVQSAVPLSFRVAWIGEGESRGAYKCMFKGDY